MTFYTWSIPGHSRSAYVPRTATGTWKDYMTANYPAYAALGLHTWNDVYKYLQEKKDAEQV